MAGARWWWLLVVARALGGCGDEGTTPRTGVAHEEGDVLSATVGPDGGTLQGRRYGRFNGVELVLPPGALTEQVEITIRPVGDDTALPRLAEPVGQQFEISPVGLALAMPASLTLPVVADRVHDFGQLDGDVKVWLRDPIDGWTLQPPTDTAEGRVTISLSDFTVAGAGVKLAASKPSCDGVGLNECNPGSCTAPQGFCVLKLGLPSPRPPEGLLGVGSHYVYYFSHPTLSSTAAQRFDLDDGQVTSASPLAQSHHNFPPNSDTDGSVWSGSNSPTGNVNYRFGSATVQTNLGRFGLGILVTAQGTAVRFSSATSGEEGRSARVGGVFGPIEPWGSAIGNHATWVPDRTPGSDGYWAKSEDSSVKHFDAPSGALTAKTGKPRACPSDTYLETSAPDGSLAGVQSIYNPAGPAQRKLVLAHGPSSALAVVPLPFQVGSMSFDAQGGLWLTALTAAQVYYLSPTDELSSVLLAPLDADAALIADNAVLTVLALSDGSAVVLTAARELLRIQRKP